MKVHTVTTVEFDDGKICDSYILGVYKNTDKALERARNCNKFCIFQDYDEMEYPDNIANDDDKRSYFWNHSVDHIDIQEFKLT